jgi:hypothetical protein
MFSTYGISGQVFNGTLEEMDRVYSTSRSRPVRAIAKDGDELGIGVAAGSNPSTGACEMS